MKPQYEDDEDSNDDEYEYRAGHAKHTCTDCICLLGFFAAIGYLIHVTMYAMEFGDWKRLYHGYDFRGRLCGVDKDENNVTLGKMLYWCPTWPEVAGQEVSLSIPTGVGAGVCIEECPAGSAKKTTCAVLPPVWSDEVPGVGLDVKQTVTYKFKELTDYPTDSFAHRYCMPSDPTLRKIVMDTLGGDKISVLITETGEFISAWVPLVCSCFIAFITGYLFLLIIRYLAYCLVVGCILILTVGAYAGSAFFIVARFREDINATNDETWDTIVAVGLFIVATFFTVIACCAWTSIKTAIGCVEAACECMFAMPSLIIEPLVNLVFKIAILIALLAGLALLITTGEVQTLTLQEVAAISVPGSELSGFLRSFEWSEQEHYYLLYYLFMIYWIMELMTALGQFVVSYAVQLWYFTPYEDNSKDDVPCCGIMRGYAKGIFFHLGSLAFGSLIVAVLSIFRTIMAVISKQAQAAAGGNAVVGCAVKACNCCLWCFQRFIQFLNKNAYMDIAITSSNFCVAAKRALTVIVENVAAVAFLNGSTWIIEWLGLGAITFGSAYLSYLMVTLMAPFNDPIDDHYVEAPTFFAVVVGFIAAVIARAFMTVFDTTSDTILYCFAVETERRKKGEFGANDRFAPSRLNALIQEYS